jgi:hypothetical protein
MKITLLIILFLVILAIIMLVWLGIFKKVPVAIARQGGEALVFESLKGDYRQSAAAMDRVYYQLLNDDGIETFKGFGIYYDNPEKVNNENLRSEAGCIVENKDLEKLKALGDKYQVKIFPEADYVVSEFPYKNKLSVFVSLMKVYPALNKFVENNGHDPGGFVMEIYDIPNKRIYYRKQI